VAQAETTISINMLAAAIVQGCFIRLPHRLLFESS